MAQYNVGDRVRIFIPQEMTIPRIGTITDILEDNGNNGQESRYRVSWTNINGLVTRYRPYDRHITIMNRATEVVPVDPQPAPAAEAVPHLEDNTTEVLMTAPAFQWLGINIPTHEQIEADARANIEAYRLHGVLPEMFVVIGRRAIPVYDSILSRNSVQREDYRPTSRSERFFKFNIPGNAGITLIPHYNVTFGTMDFTSPDGDTWSNTFENAAVTNIRPIVLDNIGVNWASRRDLMEQRRAVQGQATPVTRDTTVSNAKRPKKKLRRKYKEMPKIREEKYYATKEFIA